MRKLFTVKPGKMISLFLLLGIVALQWSFTSATTGENRTVRLLTDTSTTPVPGTTVATPKKPASTRTNRTTTSSKQALAANLERETISFGSPTDGPNTESGIPKVNTRKTTVMGSAKTTGVKATEAKDAEAKTNDVKAADAKVKTTDTKAPGAKAAEAKATEIKTNDVKAADAKVKTTDAKTPGAKAAEAKATEIKTTDTKVAGAKDAEVKAPDTKAAGTKKTEINAPDAKASGTKNAEIKTPDTKATDAKNPNTKSPGTSSPKSNGTANPKSEITPNKKAAPVEDQHVDEMISNITRTVSNEIVDTRTTSTVAIRKVEPGSTSVKSTATENNKSAAAAKTTGTTNTKRPGATSTKNADTKSTTTVGAKTIVTAAGTKTTSSIGILSTKLTVYDSLHLKQAGLSKKVFSMALTGMSKLVTGRHIKDNLLAIVDFSQPSNKKRLYVIDLNTYQLLYNTYVAHGMKSGRAMAQSFSNKPESSKSSLGFYITGPAYQGTNGYSLRLTGVEKGINDHAMDRGIVIHGADYVCEGLIESQGFIGRSFGCPAVAQEVSQELIDLLKEGSCLFIYHPSQVYKAKSLMLR